ncbi:hypothetical protein OT109_06565 [Phycisphaeraceae bacterium D3-23]
MSVFREDEEGVGGLTKVRAEVGPGIVLLTDYEAAVTGAYSQEGFKTYILDPAGVVRAELGGTVRTRPGSEAIMEALATVIEQDTE